MRVTWLLLILCFLLGCGLSVPITFHGQSFNDYLDKSRSDYYSVPAAIQQRWQLISISGNSAPFGVKLAEHNFFIYFRTSQAGKGNYQFGGKMTQGFWGEYTFDEQCAIEILMMKGMEKIKSDSVGSLESLFERILVNAETYEITGENMMLYSSTDTLRFISPEPSTSR
ncbi:MAG: hypothetical protein WBA23_20410 [Tunicatimonas sp.]|uniref:hypothetical protein n=1 Tax=Tunicatimonas sp. TaxID=1940096 RepID=UPI003C767EAA